MICKRCLSKQSILHFERCPEHSLPEIHTKEQFQKQSEHKMIPGKVMEIDDFNARVGKDFMNGIAKRVADIVQGVMAEEPGGIYDCSDGD